MQRKILTIILLLLTALIYQGCEGQGEKSSVEKPAEKRVTVQKDQMPTTTIVALGDSLTAGYGVELEDSYPSLLQRKLEADGYAVRVVNAGVSGETSSGTLSRLDWILSQKPDIVILVIGANDGLRGIDTGLVEANIDGILQRLEQSGVVTVLGGMKMVRNLGDEYTEKFDSIYPRLAGKHQVIFMPFFLEEVAATAELNNNDGIHPNERGYEIITENIYPFVIRALENLPGKG